jgi:hypothetical protein
MNRDAAALVLAAWVCAERIEVKFEVRKFGNVKVLFLMLRSKAS